MSDRRQNVEEQKPNLQTAGRISAESIAASAPENYAQKSSFLQYTNNRRFLLFYSYIKTLYPK